MTSDGTVSILCHRLDESLAAADGATWSWSVAQGVPPTDPAVKGGDDSNLVAYFVFADPETARGLADAPLRRLTTAGGV